MAWNIFFLIFPYIGHNSLTPPHHTPPHPSNWSWKSSACVCRTARRNMNVITTPPHPTRPHPTPPVTDHEGAVPVFAGQQERWWGCCACVCTGTWTLLPHATPPHPTGHWSWNSSACVCRTAGKMMRLRLCVRRNMNVITTRPHPTGPQVLPERSTFLVL